MTSECNECNEALNAARAAITAARRLALVAENALVNGDLRRARAALQNLHDTTTKGATLDAAPNRPTVTLRWPKPRAALRQSSPLRPA